MSILSTSIIAQFDPERKRQNGLLFITLVYRFAILPFIPEAKKDSIFRFK